MPTAPRLRVDSGAGRFAGAGVRLPVLLVIIGILVSGLAVWAPAAEQRASSERAYGLTRNAQAMLTSMLDQETGLRGYILTADRRFLAPYRSGRVGLSAAERALLAEAAGDPAITDAIASSAQIAASWQQEAQETVDVVARGGAGTRDTAAALKRKAIMDRFRAANGRVQTLIDARRRRALARSEVVPVVSILLLAAAGIGIGWALVVRPRRRAAAARALARRYAAEQQEFTEALQMTGSEEEANELLERHLERSLPDSDALVLRRNNSDNRLEATGLEPADPIGEALADAEPRSCMAIRYGRPHHQSESAPPLVACELCGASDSVSQAGPVLAKLRTLAKAERQAATDALTGMANARAVQDTLKRMVAHAQRTEQALTAVMV